MAARKPITIPHADLALAITRYARHSVEVPCTVPGLHPTCWIARSALGPHPCGSGGRQVSVPGYRSVTVHWASWIVHFGPVPDDDPKLQLDHLCGLPMCWNPWHLDLVDQFANMGRVGSYEQMKARHARIEAAVMSVMAS